jgi:hypothetical protein
MFIIACVFCCVGFTVVAWPVSTLLSLGYDHCGKNGAGNIATYDINKLFP